jgi:hypothetical protein
MITQSTQTEEEVLCTQSHDEKNKQKEDKIANSPDFQPATSQVNIDKSLPSDTCSSSSEVKVNTKQKNTSASTG